MIFLLCNRLCYADKRNPSHNQAKAVDEFAAGLEFAARNGEMKGQIEGVNYGRIGAVKNPDHR
jgi:hypothetical protein